MKKTGFYIIKDQFFEDMSDPYLKGNKSERRPHYYCFKDTKENIYWMIPLSSKIDKYRKVMGMLKRGIKFTPTQPDIMAMLKMLRES